MHSVNRKEQVKRLREKRASRQEIYMQMSKTRLQNTQWFEAQKFDIHNVHFSPRKYWSHAIKYAKQFINNQRHCNGQEAI